MGQLLSSPRTETQTDFGKSRRFFYASSCMQGWRLSMEDAHTTLLEVDNHEDLSFFGVYDGHGGNRVANYCGVNLHIRIIRDEAFSRGDYVEAIKNAFLGIDRDILQDPEYSKEQSGCTAVVGLVPPDNCIYVGNAGDSRALISVNGCAKALSVDHKPNDEMEMKRIHAAGGFVEAARVNGNLALSRAIGDFEFKRNTRLNDTEQIVVAYPDVVVHSITEEDEFFVLACDGIWDSLSCQEVVDFVRDRVVRNNSLPEICEQLMRRCLASDYDGGIKGYDNMTVVIVGILNGTSVEEWYEKIRSRHTLNSSIPGTFNAAEEERESENSEEEGSYTQEGIIRRIRTFEERFIRVIGPDGELPNVLEFQDQLSEMLMEVEERDPESSEADLLDEPS